MRAFYWLAWIACIVAATPTAVRAAPPVRIIFDSDVDHDCDDIGALFLLHGAVQRGEAPGESWSVVPAARFFEELLAECVEGYYSAPAAQDEIGYAGFADAHGWQAVGVDQLQTHEPRSLPAETPGEHV